MDLLVQTSTTNNYGYLYNNVKDILHSHKQYHILYNLDKSFQKGSRLYLNILHYHPSLIGTGIGFSIYYYSI